jgi:hypothetical protein
MGFRIGGKVSKIVRRRTIGIAMDLFKDLVENLAFRGDYQDDIEYKNDVILHQSLFNWLNVERQDETEVDEFRKKWARKKR